jgi:hypothetical protein
MMHEVVILVIPEKEQDFILTTLRFRESLPKELRKHLCGPIVTTDGNRTFTLLPCEGANADKCRQDFVAHSKSNVNSRCIHVHFGNGCTGIAFSTDPTHLNEKSLEQLKVLGNEVQRLKESLENRTEELNEIIGLRTRDQVLSAAIKELEVITANRKLLDVAKEIAEECENSTNGLPEPLIRLIRTAQGV